MANNLDEFDRRLLRAVQQDSSRSSAQLAEAVGLSQAPCWRRLQKLKEQGYIKGEVALVDRKRLGWEIELFVHVKLTSHGRANVADFIAAIAGHPQVLECFVLLGNVDLMLRVIARDIADYERFFFDHLSKAPGVQEANTMTVLGEIKSTRAVPI